jgi:hypothetical protein
LVQQGHPIFWFDDVTAHSPLFQAAQFTAAREWLPADSSTLHFTAISPLSGSEIVTAIQQANISKSLSADAIHNLQQSQNPTWEGLRKKGLQISSEKSGQVNRGDFAVWLLNQVKTR